MNASVYSNASSKNLALETLKKGIIPKHVAIIMDGNGRWAVKHQIPKIFGHRKGAEVLRKIVMACKDLGIKYLTAFSFSSENWQRPEKEVKELMILFVEVLKLELDGMIKNNVRLSLIGQREAIPEKILKVFEDSEIKTKNNTGVFFNIAFSYGARQEILDAVKRIASLPDEEKRSNLIKLDDAIFSDHLYTAGIPDPDLLIRTSGEYRVSNFLLWQIAYTELYFTKTLWPDFKRADFYKAISDFQKRTRRFGK